MVDVDGIGVTQGRTVTEAEEMARDLVAVMLDVSFENVSVDIDFTLPAPLDSQARQARRAVHEAAAAQTHAAALSRRTVADLKQAGLTGKDAARILGISPQRVSQLLKEENTQKSA